MKIFWEESVKIDGVGIGVKYAPYIVAELSGNHNNSINNILELIKECKQAGVSAIKIQTYTADSMTVNSVSDEFVIKGGTWAGRNLYDLYSEGHTPAHWLPEIFSAAKALGVTLFSTPFSPADVQILEDFNVPAYKVASFEITYTQLLREIGSTRKPVIFSTGLAKIDEISEAIDILTKSGASEIAILKCTTNYPADFNDLNLSSIPLLQKKFDLPVGFSDHTIGATAAIVATALGASIIEKHVKLDSDNTSVDSSFSLNVSKLENFILKVNQAAVSVGSIQDGPTESEKSYLRYRRSLIAKKEIKCGDLLTSENVAIVRPNLGLSPNNYDEILGKRANRNIAFGEGIKLDFIN
jgi:N-acetylneuraminate synthase